MRSYKKVRGIGANDWRLHRSMSWNRLIHQYQNYVATLVAYITVKTNHIKPLPRTSQSFNEATTMFKHAIPSIVTCHALQAYNIVHPGDSLRIRVIDSNDDSINHCYGWMIGFDGGSRLYIVHLDTHTRGIVTLDHGEKRYIHPQYLLRVGHTRNHKSGKGPKLLWSFHADIMTDQLKNIVHYQTVAILKHIHKSLRLYFLLIWTKCLQQ